MSRMFVLVFACVACTEAPEGVDPGDSTADEPWTPYTGELPYDFAAHAPWYSCPDASFPDDATVVTVFDGVDQYFGAENFRTIMADATFPEQGEWVQVGLWFQLDCPASGLCDHWDRAGSVALELNPDRAEGEARESVELVRQITPYRKSMCQYVDITPVAGLLKGEQTLSSYIDTWVGPGHAQGEGWRTTVKAVFYPGPDQTASEVINVWGMRSITVGEIEEDRNIDSQVEAFDFELSGASHVDAHLTVTGHSFGNTDNCAEFCKMDSHVSFNGVDHQVKHWRNDCDQNEVANQAGTWEYGRNGWCPGAISVGDIVDVTADVADGANALDLDFLMRDGSEYDNVSPVDLLPYNLTSLKLYVYE